MKLKKIISCLVSVIISLVCFSGMTAIAEDDDELITIKSISTRMSDSADAITTVKRYSSGKILVTVFSDLHYDAYSSPGTYDTYTYRFIIRPNTPIDNNTIHFTSYHSHFNDEPVQSYFDNYTEFRWIARTQHCSIESNKLFEFYFYTKSEYNTSCLYFEIGDETNIVYPINILSKSNNVESVTDKDTQIRTLNETIEALRSEIDYIKAKQPVCGDTDGNGRISISDSIILNRYLAGTVDSLPCSDPPPLAPEDEGE